MPTPQGIQTVTLHGLFVEPDLQGTPLKGSVTFTPNPSVITFPIENTIMSGTETAELDANGEFTIQLPCTDTPGQNPTGWTYSVTERLIGPRQRTYQILLPYSAGQVELSDIAPTPAEPTYLPVTGPQGPPGLVQSVNGISVPDIVLSAGHVGAIPTSEKAANDGVATLDGLGKLTSTQVPDLSTSYLTVAQRNAANGVAGLDAASKVVATYLNLAVSAPPAVGTNTVGVSTLMAREDHTHEGVALTGNQTVAGNKTFTGDIYANGGRLGVGIAASLLGRTHLKSTVDETSLYVENTLVSTTAPMQQFVGAAATATAFAAGVAGDTVPRIAWKTGGSLEWGPGNGARDTAIYRSSVGVVSSLGQFASDSATPTAANHLTRKDYVDTAIAGVSGGGATNMATTDTEQTISAPKNFEGATATSGLIRYKVTADSFSRGYIRADGRMLWGSGSAAQDVYLHRTGVGALEVNGSLNTTGTLSAGNWDLSSMGLFNVKKYGATGAGSGNEDTFIQAALNAATVVGGQVIVPAGVYLVGAVLRVYQNTRLTLLPGAEFRRNYAGTMIINGDAGQNLGGYTGHGNIIIEGGLWNMRGTTAGLTASAMCISLGHAQGITVRDLEIRNVPGFHAIEINAVKDAKILNCRFRGYVDPGGRDFSEAIQPDGAISSGVFGGFGPYDMTFCEDVLIQGCYFGASGTAGTTAWPRGIGSHSARVGRWHLRTRIIGNTFEGLLQYACSIYNYKNVVIQGNTFSGCGSSVRLRSIIESDTEDTKDTSGNPTGGGQEMTNISVVGNTMIAGTGYDDNIIALGETSGYIRQVTIGNNVLDASTNNENGIRLQKVQRATLTGNQINNIAGTGISTEDCVHLDIVGNEIYTPAAHGITAVTVTLTGIHNNQVKYPGNNGILLQGGSDLQLTGNFIKSPGRTTTGTWYGIRASTSAASLFLRNNKVRPNGSGNEAINGFSATNTCTLITRAGNDWRGSTFTGGALDDLSTTPNTTATDLT